jgi:hypothetical protein
MEQPSVGAPPLTQTDSAPEIGTMAAEEAKAALEGLRCHLESRLGGALMDAAMRVAKESAHALPLMGEEACAREKALLLEVQRVLGARGVVDDDDDTLASAVLILNAWMHAPPALQALDSQLSQPGGGIGHSVRQLDPDTSWDLASELAA